MGEMVIMRSCAGGTHCPIIKEAAVDVLLSSLI